MPNDKYTIHETAITDILSNLIGDTAKAVTSIPVTLGRAILGSKNNTNSYSSLAKATSNLVLTFPVIVDESVPLDTAKMISKSIEKKAVVMLQMLFAAISAQYNAKNAFELIQKVHNNLNTGDIEDYIQRMEVYGTKEDAVLVRNAVKAIMEDMKNINVEFSESYNKPIARFIIDPNNGSAYERTYYSEANTPNKNDRMSGHNTQGKEYPNIVPGDIKKANELMPTMMIINFVTKDDSGNIVKTTPAVVGVKAKIQYVSQEDMINRLASKNSDKNGLFNFIRATTREISFFKDFLFALDKAKLDTLGIRKGSTSSIWRILERRASKSRYNTALGKNNDAAAITSVIISRDSAEVLYKDYDLRLTPNTTLDIMNGYNLLAFFIADDIKQRVDFIYDDYSHQYETLSYSAIEREDNGDYKKIINLLAAKR